MEREARWRKEMDEGAREGRRGRRRAELPTARVAWVRSDWAITRDTRDFSMVAVLVSRRLVGAHLLALLG